jgi:sialic acid synthase SpsE
MMINDSEITQLWSNYQTDYRLWSILLKENLRFIATNIPRRYASMINKMGIKALKIKSRSTCAD